MEHVCVCLRGFGMGNVGGGASVEIISTQSWMPRSAWVQGAAAQVAAMEQLLRVKLEEHQVLLYF